MILSRTYDEYINAVKSLLGLEEILTTEVGWLNYSLNDRLEDSRKSARWPGIVVVEQRTPVSGVIDYDQATELVIDKVWGVYDKDPRGKDLARPINFALSTDGIVLKETVTGDVWVEYTDGYVALDATEILTVEIPKQLFNYCVWGAIADYWSARGEDAKAELAETKAIKKILDEQRSLFGDQKQRPRTNYKTSISQRTI